MNIFPKSDAKITGHKEKRLIKRNALKLEIFVHQKSTKHETAEKSFCNIYIQQRVCNEEYSKNFYKPVSFWLPNKKLVVSLIKNCNRV